MAVIRTGRGSLKAIGDRQAGDSAPAIADFEEFEGVDELFNLVFGEPFAEDDREDTRRSGEVSLPEFMAGAGAKRGMEDLLDLRTLGQPPGQNQRAFFNRLQTDGQGFHAAQGQTAVFGRNAAAAHLISASELLPAGFVFNAD